MRRSQARPREGDRSWIAHWWNAVLAGETDEPHPVFGDRVSVRVAGGRLVISGQLDRREDRDELLREARSRVGHGIQEVDTSHLTVVENHETRGLLDQTLIAAFPDRETAELARKFVVERSRVTPKQQAIVDHRNAGDLRKMLPEGFVEDARRRVERGDALVVLRVDETEAFQVREILEEDTRSSWTIATPPSLIAAGR
ncbi:MAG: hypothetical protein E6J06_06430 [Chloroflexi bacterium]|nr:MAG: hypothetical protein E6J06_06430 [Chloroflexota bacterium]